MLKFFSRMIIAFNSQKYSRNSLRGCWPHHQQILPMWAQRWNFVQDGGEQ